MTERLPLAISMLPFVRSMFEFFVPFRYFMYASSLFFYFSLFFFGMFSQTFYFYFVLFFILPFLRSYFSMIFNFVFCMIFFCLTGDKVLFQTVLGW
jgi:hypothetical protein